MSSDFPLGVVLALLSAIICGAIYVIPSVVAFRRNHPNRWIIFAINMAFGATVIGWIGALVWALNAAHLSNQASGSHGGESGLNLFINDIQQVRIVPEPAGSPQSSFAAGPIDIQTAVLELERLKKLRLDGDLTVEQFEALKVVLLRRV